MLCSFLYYCIFSIWNAYENPLDRRFALIADHLESLAASIQDVEDLQVQDRLRREQDSTRIDRLERLFKLMIRIGDRERKELRERINALIDAQMRSEAVFADFQQKSDERMTRMQEATADFQQKSDERMTQMQEATANFQQKSDERMTRLEESTVRFQQKSDERMTRLEESNVQFQTQVGDALARLADATAHAYRRLDALESNGNG